MAIVQVCVTDFQFDNCLCFQEYPNEEKRLIGASRKLLKIAQSLMVKAIPPLSIRPDSNRDIMTGLDNIMHYE